MFRAPARAPARSPVPAPAAALLVLFVFLVVGAVRVRTPLEISFCKASKTYDELHHFAIIRLHFLPDTDQAICS